MSNLLISRGVAVVFALNALVGWAAELLLVAPQEGAVVTQPLKLQSTQSHSEVTNLLIGQKYYWRVVAKVNDTEGRSAVGTFLTEDRAPRLLAVKGVPNVRDLGGWGATAPGHWPLF